MNIKDWAMNAAMEIIAGTKYCEDRPTDVEMADIILKHSPFKDGVAYMEVPRCDRCAYWTFRPEYVEPHGACTADKIGSDCNDYTIIVPADFGCVQWKGR